MRICIVNEYFHPDSTGGTGTELSNLARNLCDNYDDVEIDVITSRNLYRTEVTTLPSRECWDGINIYRVATPRPSKTSTKARLAANFLFSAAATLQLLRRRYDVLIVATAPPTTPIAARAYKRLTGTPYIYIVYDLYPDIAVALQAISKESRLTRIFHRMQKTWLHGASRTIVLGRCMQDYLGRHYSLDDRNIQVIPIGSDPELIRPMPRSTRFRAANDLKDFVVLYAGNFGRHQNFDTIIDAAKRIGAVRNDISFVFVGDGAQKEYITNRKVEEHIDNLYMFPFVPKEDLSDLLASGDVSLVTLEPGAEGLGVPSKFYNILAAGRPSIALVSPISEVARVIAEAQCGIQINQADVEKLTSTVIEYADSPELTARMGVNARRVLVDKYTNRHVSDRFMMICAAAVGREALTEAHVLPARTKVEH